MYRRSRFLEILIAIREEMAREADFDVDLFVENVRTGHRAQRRRIHSLSSNGQQPNPERPTRSKKAKR
jgi:hypothetical protein